jgi:hypothetical protein
MIEERNDILSQIFERYERINGRKILDALKKEVDPCFIY